MMYNEDIRAYGVWVSTMIGFDIGRGYFPGWLECSCGYRRRTPGRWQVLPHEQHMLYMVVGYSSSGKRDCRSTEFRHYHVREHFLDRYKHQICLLRPASSRLLTNFLLTLPLLEVLQGAFRSIFRRLTYQSLTAGINNANIQCPIYSNIRAQIQRCSSDKLSCL